MSRGPRQTPGGIVYHVLNRAVARLPLFEKAGDYAAFLRVLSEALDECPMRILAYVLMPNHWHLVLCPLFCFRNELRPLFCFVLFSVFSFLF